VAVHDAQRDLAQVLKANDVRRTLVHARGGSIVRGGSRIDALLRSAPPETINGSLALTEQGETINHGFGLKPNAMRTLERGFSALALATQAVRTGQAQPEPEALHAAAITAARTSRETWTRLVLEDRDFYDFFRAVTPIDVIERMQIGSRTIWETLSGSAIQAVRATPWVFAWSQARYFMPGWYGAGAGLAAAMETHGIDTLRAAYRDWMFFGTMIDDLEATLARTDLRVARAYAGLASPGLKRFEAPLEAEYLLAVDQVLRIKQVAELLDTDRTLQRAVQLRNPYVDPMHLMQVDLLRRWRSGGRQDDDLFQALLASVSGIAAGLQTTG
jgi:phosphoenolpyruvate carboxylase